MNYPIKKRVRRPKSAGMSAMIQHARKDQVDDVRQAVRMWPPGVVVIEVNLTQPKARR